MEKFASGCCMYCGQAQKLPANEELTGIEGDRYITAHCTCPDARKEQMREEQHENLKKLFDAESVESGFMPVDEGTMDYLDVLLESVELDALISVTAVLPDGDVAKIRRIGNGRVSITRIAKRQASM